MSKSMKQKRVNRGCKEKELRRKEGKWDKKAESGLRW